MELLGTKDFPFYAMIFLISSTLVLLGLEECNYLPIIFFAGLFFYVSKNPTDDPWAFWLFLIFVSLQLAKLKLPTKLIPKRDLSYGLYLYGFPTEQCLIRYLPDMGPYRLFVISLCFCLLLASASWRFVEKYAIQYARSRPIFS
jgi:peptidoglycan/LPS O-acetylase OafA/YrhL